MAVSLHSFPYRSSLVATHRCAKINASSRFPAATKEAISCRSFGTVTAFVVVFCAMTEKIERHRQRTTRVRRKGFWDIGPDFDTILDLFTLWLLQLGPLDPVNQGVCCLCLMDCKLVPSLPRQLLQCDIRPLDSRRIFLALEAFLVALVSIHLFSYLISSGLFIFC